jgi:HK97 family phage portal protein
MRLFGIELGGKKERDFSAVSAGSRHWTTLFDWKPGAFQQDTANPDSESVQDALGVAVVYACLRQIVWDISKLRICVKRLVGEIWQEGGHQTILKLLRRPNPYQTWIDFLQSWLLSWLIAGDTFIIKGRRNGSVVELHVLRPDFVTPLVAPDTGAVFYRVKSLDGLVGIEGEQAIFAATDVIHHRYLAITHPLVGSSCLARAQLAARMRSGIITTGAEQSENGGVPPGVLTAPEGMTDAQLTEIADKWAGRRKGRIAVVDAAFKFEAVAAKYIDSQSKEFAELSAGDICTAFNMPPWKVGVGARPAGFDVEAQQIIYFQDCLQLPIEHIEMLLDDGLELAADVSVEFDIDGLTMMDSKAKAEVITMLVNKGLWKPNEGRAKYNLPPVEGGDTVYMQQQNYSLPALAKRDAAAPAPAGPGASPTGPADPEPETDKPPAPGGDPEDVARRRRTASSPWMGVWDAGKEYPTGGGFVTHKAALWARVTRTEHGEEDFSAGAEIGAEPGTPEGAPYWQLALKSNRKEG